MQAGCKPDTIPFCYIQNLGVDQYLHRHLDRLICIHRTSALHIGPFHRYIRWCARCTLSANAKEDRGEQVYMLVEWNKKLSIKCLTTKIAPVDPSYLKAIMIIMCYIPRSHNLIEPLGK
jgi:hypothetical protein